MHRMQPCVRLCLLSIVLAAAAIIPQRPASAGPRLGPIDSSALFMVRFEENRGQAAPEVRYIARGAGAPALLSATSLTMGSPDADGRMRWMRMRLLGADAEAEAVGMEPTEAKTSYYIGSDPAKWRTNIPSFRKVQFEKVYPGIDLLYYGAMQPDAKLEYDFVIEPGADPSRIELEFDGYEDISLGTGGDLLLRGPAGLFRQLRPVVYQLDSEGRSKVEGRFLLAADGRVRFALGDYDRTRTLVIDPGFEYSTFFGGNGDDQAFGIEVDSQGNAYITGFTASTDFETSDGAAQTSLRGPTDAFVASLNSTGSELRWSTYLGGRGRDQAWDIAIDSNGNAFITGFTDSPDYPTTDGSGPSGGRDSFTSVIGPSGALAFSSRQGGSVDDVGWQIDVATLDQGVFVVTVGETASGNFPATPDAFQGTYGGGASDGFIDVLRFEAGAGFGEPLNRATSFHGGGGFDIVDSIALGKLTVNIGFKEEVPFWVSSTTSSDGLFISDQAPQPERGGGTDGYVTELRLDPTFGDTFSRDPEFGGYIGGSGDERETVIELTEVEKAIVILSFSVTESTDFPATPGAFMTEYPGGPQSLGLTITRIEPATGVTVRVASYFGGRDFDQGPGLVADPNGSPVISGFTFSTNFPTTPDAPGRQHPGGGFAGFVGRFLPDLSDIDFATYVGGASSNAPNVTVDQFGQIYVVGIGPASWPTTPGAFQEGFGGAPWDATVTKLGGPFLPRLGLVNGSSFLQGSRGGVSSQEITTQFGSKIGPSEPAELSLGPDGTVTRELDGTRVSFNDDIVAMIFASINQTSFVAPRIPVGFRFLHPEDNAAFATIRFEVDGVLSNVLRVPLIESNPGIFSLNATGQGQGAILNPDFSVNGPDNPAPFGGFIIVFGTGGGVVDPICPDATLAPGVEPLPRLTLPQRATIGGVEAQILYAGAAPDLVCGVNQWNVVPMNHPSGPAIPIQICSGDNCTQEGITAAFE